jgi:hypothetical protein
MSSVSLWATLTQRVLYPLRFRRKPAISGFVWLFTPRRKSSPPIATDVGSVLQKVSPFLQPAHDEITRFRVQILGLYLLRYIRISYASTYRLKLATKLDSLTHYAKGTLSLYYT